MNINAKRVTGVRKSEKTHWRALWQKEKNTISDKKRWKICGGLPRESLTSTVKGAAERDN